MTSVKYKFEEFLSDVHFYYLMKIMISYDHLY